MNGPAGTLFAWWDEAIEWARLRAIATGVHQSVQRSGDWWRVAPR